MSSCEARVEEPDEWAGLLVYP